MSGENMPTQHTAPRPRVAVLGATGCVGRAVCAAFEAGGDEVLAVARNHAPHVGRYPFVPLDVAAADPAKIAEVLESERIGVVVNATGGWGRTEAEMTYAHIQLIDRLLAGVAAADLEQPVRVVHVGSIHEYGEVPHGTMISESTPSRPATPYARSKLAGSNLVVQAGRDGVVQSVVLKAVNVCGPYTTPASFLGALAARIGATPSSEPLELTVADAQRDFVDVRDLAQAVVAAASVPAAAGRVVNIGRGEAYDIRELVRLLFIAAGRPEHLIAERSAAVQSKGGGWTCADASLAAGLLGWRPQVGMPESMAALWRTSLGIT
jgi:nucleoside-diphosphate-sugar epimerase